MERQQSELILGNTKLMLTTDERAAAPSFSDAHAHPSYELFFVREGQVKIQTEDETYVIAKDQSALICPGCYHRTSTEPGTEKINIYFSYAKRKGGGDDIYTLLQGAFSGTPVRLLKSATEIGRLAFSLRRALENECFCKAERVNALFAQLIFELYDLLPKRKEQPSKDVAAGVQYRYEIDRLMSQNYANDIDLEFLASALFLSKKRVAVLIRSLYGKSFSQVKVEMRIQVAKQLLRESDLGVAEVGRRVGYNSTRGFLSAFSALTNKTPSEYRASKKLTK